MRYTRLLYQQTRLSLYLLTAFIKMNAHLFLSMLESDKYVKL